MIIYKVTNRINGMCYVGATKRSLQERWMQHIRDARSNGKWCKFKLQKAIQEFGESNFIVEEIDSAATKDEANEKEMHWIKFYDCVKHGYNTSIGGKNGGSRKSIQCVETGVVYDTVVEAEKANGIKKGAIYAVIDNPHLLRGGFHWISVKKP